MWIITARQHISTEVTDKSTDGEDEEDIDTDW